AAAELEEEGGAEEFIFENGDGEGLGCACAGVLILEEVGERGDVAAPAEMFARVLGDGVVDFERVGSRRRKGGERIERAEVGGGHGQGFDSELRPWGLILRILEAGAC